jgi:hypothetical protein
MGSSLGFLYAREAASEGAQRAEIGPFRRSVTAGKAQLMIGNFEIGKLRDRRLPLATIGIAAFTALRHLCQGDGGFAGAF